VDKSKNNKKKSTLNEENNLSFFVVVLGIHRLFVVPEIHVALVGK
jgi:hypothetical protein